MLFTGAGKALGDDTLFVESRWKYVSFYNETERKSPGFFEMTHLTHHGNRSS